MLLDIQEVTPLGKSQTYPDLNLEPLIPLDSKIAELQKKFSSQNQKIILKGPSGSGKTVHLAEFVKANANSCFSYFLSDSYWYRRKTAFLASLCQQMEVVLGITSKSTLSVENPNLDSERLEFYFETLVSKIIDTAKKTKQTYYFVIDGLEWAFNGKPGEKIADLLPLQTNSKHLFFLGSICTANANLLDFDHISDEPRTFSSLETRTYLEASAIELTEKLLSTIQIVSSGIPGYLSALRELHVNGIQTVAEAIKKPSAFEDLLKIQWNASVNGATDADKYILASIAYSVVPISTNIISQVTNQEEDYINDLLPSSGMVRQNKDCEWVFYPDIVKRIAQDRLHKNKDAAINQLISFYEKHNYLKESRVLLPEYYLQSNKDDGIENLLRPSSIATSIADYGDLGLIRHTLSYAKELAYKNAQKTNLTKYSLLSAELRSLSTEAIGESEIRALISLDQFEKAIDLTYAIKIDVLKMRLLGKIYSSMERKGLTLTKTRLDELKQMAERLETNGLDPTEVLYAAADIFPVLPDVSTSMIDNLKGQQNTQTAMDLIYALSSINSKTKSDDDIIEKIGDKNLREMALMAPWLSKLSWEEVISKSSKTTHTKAKVFMLREWCLQNKTDPNLYKVVNETLSAINSDSSYKVPLRQLRQLSNVLRSCSPDQILGLAQRFDVPIFTSLRSPIEERLRLELNIAEAESLVAPRTAWERFHKIYSEIKELPLDADVSCYCYTRCLISLRVIDPEDTNRLSIEIEKKLEDEFIRLIDTAANQLDLSKRILKSLSLVKPNLALALADMLNTIDRRDEGIREVLLSYVRQDRVKVEKDIIHDGLGRIKDNSRRESTIIKLVETANRSSQPLNANLKSYFLDLLNTIQDDVLLGNGLTHLIVAYSSEQEASLRKDLFEKLINLWQEMDIAWIRTESAFNWVSQIAKVDINLAEELYQRAVELRETVPLANQAFGNLYFQSLQQAVKVVGHIDFKHENEKHLWVELENLIELLPSRILKAHTLARIALAKLYQAGDKETFDRLMQDYVMTELQYLAPSVYRERLISRIAVAIYEYSSEEAVKLVKGLSYKLRNITWVDMIVRILLQINIGESYDSESPNVPIDLPRANKAVSIIENFDHDELLYSALDTLTHLVSLPQCQLNENQKLDILTQLDTIVEKKLPDPKNIDHIGYKVLAMSSIEAARRRSAKKAKNNIKKNHNAIIQAAKSEIDNIADKVFVLSIIASDFRGIENQTANSLLNEAFSIVESIPNVKDRINRLETIIESYSKLNNTSGVEAATQVAARLANSLDGIERDTALSSLIQTVHQVDKDLAAEITESIEDAITDYQLDVGNASYDLSKSPHKLLTHFKKYSTDDDVVRAAVNRMLRAVNSNKGVSYQEETMLDWLAAGAQLEHQTMVSIFDWITEVTLRQSPSSALAQESVTILETIIQNCNILYSIGSQILPLVKITDSIRGNFQGLSLSREKFRVGERNRAIAWLRNWLHTNAKGYVAICDPYFDETQVWIMQYIPVDVQVRIVCSGKGLDLKVLENDPTETRRKNKLAAKAKLSAAWKSTSDQSSPPTLVVIHNSVYEGDQDKFHDRYITTEGAGISIGTSLSGLGRQESFITVLNPEDTRMVESTYIFPKLSIEQYFSQVIYFELEE